MKNFIVSILAFSFFVSAVPASAQAKVPAIKPLTTQELVVEDSRKFKFTFEQALQDPAATRAAVDTVVYDLEHMEDVLKDLDENTVAAANAPTQQVVNEVRRRFVVANALMTSLMIDTKMDHEKKMNYLAEISSALGQVLFAVIREHGEDKDRKIEDMKSGVVAGVLRLPRELLLDATALIRMRRADKLREVDASGKEINPGPGPFVPAIVERGRRDILTLELIQELQESIHMTLNRVDSDSEIATNTIPVYWGEKVIPRMIKLRGLRLTAQRVAAFSYLGLALWGGIAPAFDMVGFFDGGRSENSLVDSSMIYAAWWTSIMVVKSATTSSSAVRELKKLVAMTKDAKITPTRGNISSFWARFGASVGVLKDGCASALSSKK